MSTTHLPRLGLFSAALLIIAACLWRDHAGPSEDEQVPNGQTGVMSSAPRFEGLDLQNRMFRLESLVGRHEIDLLFLNDITEADSRAAIEVLKSRARLDFSPRAVRSNTAWSETQLVVVTTSLPPIVRQELARSGKFGGVIISDATGEIGRLWQTGRRPALYRINRAGQVRYNQGAPLPADSPTAPDAP